MILALTAALGLSLVGANPVALTPCSLDTKGLGRVDASCGSVVVDGATIGFAVLYATGSKKKIDPLVLLPGGPGQAFTELAGFAEIEFGPANHDRDLILFDPRGTGRSGKTSCHDTRSLPDRLRASDDEEIVRLHKCAEKLTIDPKSMNTAQLAKDLEAVRVALDVPQWNLAGISYGTRLALAYDRAYPGKVRSLVLDSVVPFSMNVGEDAALDATNALAVLDARCERAPGCRERSLVDIVRDLGRTLGADPREVTLIHPTTGARISVKFDDRLLGTVVRLLLYADESAAILPPLLKSADHGDLAPLAAQMFLADKETESLAEPMQLSVLCAEDVPFLRPQDEKKSAGATSAFKNSLDDLVRACGAWPHADVPPSFHDDLPSSKTPALLLAGTADPITPPRMIDIVKKTLPNSYAVTLAGLGHNPGTHGCLPEQIGHFLNAPTVAPDVACTGAMKPFPAFLDALGPPP